MHRSLRRIGYASTSAKILSGLCFNSLAASHRIRYQPDALVLPSAAPGSLTGRLFSCKTVSPTHPLRSWGNPSSKSINCSKPFECGNDGGLGQGERQNAPQTQVQGEYLRSGTLDRHFIHHVNDGTKLSESTPAPSRQFDVRRRHDEEATWNYFLELRGRADFFSIIDPRAERFRNRILTAALNDETRMVVFYEVAQHLRDEFRFEWPELYTRVIHHYLGNAEYDTAYLWHLRLMPAFTPTVDEFGALLASFAINSTRELQFILEKLYTFSPVRKVYDHLIPTLFEYGQSQTARSWRKFLVLFGDLPSTPRSRPFLQFCARYYPLGSLSEKELAIIRGDGIVPVEPENSNLSNSKSQDSSGRKGIYGDSFTARWFASSWASVEFAIDLMYKLGLKTVGPRSLQSLALREINAEGVASRIAQLEKLGIAITPTVYCRALVAFAKESRQDLLTALIFCDIHPEEFDDAETRRLLMYAAKRQQNQKRERLFQEIESLILGRPETNEQPQKKHPRNLNQQFEITLARGALARARLILDNMESANVSLSQANAVRILDHVFEDLWFSPKKAQQRRFGKGRDPHLDRAIQIVRRVARHDVAIPLKRWRIILYNLGRLGRFAELEELSHEIVDMYTLAPEGLFPIYHRDLPPRPKPEPTPDTTKQNQPESKDVSQIDDTSSEVPEGWPTFMDDFWRREMGLEDIDGPNRKPEQKTDDKSMPPKRQDQKKKLLEPKEATHYIPTDLPLKHQQHPISKLFDPAFQRAIVRWSFDHRLALPARSRSIVPVTTATPADFDIAWGVRFLAMLRDRGLHIDKQVLKSTLYSRIVIAQVPGRDRHRSRDQRELAPANLKRLIDAAWGSELLPALPGFIKQLEDQKPKLWHRYPRLFMKAYDHEGLQEIADEKRQKARQEPSKEVNAAQTW